MFDCGDLVRDLTHTALEAGALQRLESEREEEIDASRQVGHRIAERALARRRITEYLGGIIHSQMREGRLSRERTGTTPLLGHTL